MVDWDDALKVRGCGLYLDARTPRPACFVSHGHGDHLPQGGLHGRFLCTTATASIAERRVGLRHPEIVDYGRAVRFDADTTVTAHPAGHVLGSAMALVERPEGTLLYTGDFKLRRSRTVEPADPPRADVLLTECTYGKPHFAFPPADATATELCERVGAAMAGGRQPIVYGYALGKAQEIVRLLTDGGFTVTQHGAVANLTEIYQRHGVPLGRPEQLRRYAAGDFHGPAALDLAERGVLVAPPGAARGAFTSRFADPLRVMMTGWALTSGAPFRYGVDVCLPLSDHADFRELLETVERVRPRVVYTHHGFPEFADELRRRGIDARPARPAAQLELFG